MKLTMDDAPTCDVERIGRVGWRAEQIGVGVSRCPADADAGWFAMGGIVLASGFEAQVRDALVRGMEQTVRMEADQHLYGFSVLMNGARVDPRTVRASA